MDPCRVCDRVHGNLELPPLIGRIASTMEFARLDGVRQLGGCAYVYPSATHTRREHSLGVSHLAGRLATRIRELRPDLVSEEDVLCVQLAGLVHDLGHGPFSHVFEDFMAATPDAATCWSHEESGIDLLRYLLARRPDVRLSGTRHAVGEEQDEAHLRFVSLLVRGLGREERWDAAAFGRDERKRVLVDVVHNRSSGLDVDKLDYLLRDSLAVFGASRPFDVDRLVLGSRVVWLDGAGEDEEEGGFWAWGLDEACAFDVAQVFAHRARMHRQVYQHRAVAVVERILKDLMLHLDAAHSGLLSAAAFDASTFWKLKDDTVLGLASEAALGRSDAEDAVVHAYTRLFARPWAVRLPLSVSMRTNPTCSRCAAATSVTDAFCARCGASTADREGVLLVPSLGVLSTAECAVTEAEATEAVRRACSGVAADVYISDVHCGSFAPCMDPHGRVWRSYDPLRNVLFVAHGGHAPVPVVPTTSAAASMHVAEERHVRTAHCYVPVGTSCEDASRATVAFEEWGKRVGLASEL